MGQGKARDWRMPTAIEADEAMAAKARALADRKRAETASPVKVTKIPPLGNREQPQSPAHREER